jgi:DnaK suppressor protein
MSKTLSTEHKSIIEHTLHKRLADLKESIAMHSGGLSRVEHAREVLQQDGDDAPQRSSDREVDLAITDMDTVELSKINAALARISRADYGVCISCGVNIPYERLLIEPTTQRCVACKSQAE